MFCTELNQLSKQKQKIKFTNYGSQHPTETAIILHIMAATKKNQFC
jgi:DNA-directed RNA polymerase subunit L